ncbi:DUF922 domain-containing Zn-dependent protease [Mesorhizobium sp. KR2-14]|uniref:DUF922 domain-containing Zn-dependent protease n=1 Tax=Mesorhizobium sp. KR2-14 TaxID=3156610 RepID=UPI0032B3FAAA
MCLLAAFASSLPVVAHAEWQAVEKVETYAISGKTGPELYASIGAQGPKVGSLGIRTIAQTNFKLTWSRKYEPQKDGACTLVSARPNLTITYLLPRPSGKLPPAIRTSWEAFYSGVEAHERVHGDHIKDMVKEIEQLSIGFSVPDDAGCSKVREELTKRLAEISLAQRQRSRDFDRVELSDGGNVHQLILALVNGG